MMTDRNYTYLERLGVVFSNVGKRLLYQVEFTGFTLILIMKTFVEMRHAFSKRREIVKHMYVSGVKSMLVCSIVALFAGMIFALQTGMQVKKYGGKISYVPTMIINIMDKEFGSFLTALILTAFSGAAMAAELGTMKVSEEIDALEMMSINPVRYLVMPRVVSMMIMLPTLSIYTIVQAVLGGALICNAQLGLPLDAYFRNIQDSIWFKDMYVNILKSTVFALLISSISCANGLKAANGALGVGHATRVSVVSSFLMILIVGYFITAIFYGGFL